MRLHIGGRGGDELAPGVLQYRVERRPAGARADRFRLLERQQEGAGNKRIEALAAGLLGREAGRIGERVPCRGADLLERGNETGRQTSGGRRIIGRHGARDFGESFTI